MFLPLFLNFLGSDLHFFYDDFVRIAVKFYFGNWNLYFQMSIIFSFEWFTIN